MRLLALCAVVAATSKRRIISPLRIRRGGAAATAGDLQEVLDLRGNDTACLIAVGAEWS